MNQEEGNTSIAYKKQNKTGRAHKLHHHAKSDVCPQYFRSIGMTHMLRGLPLQKTPPSFLNLPDDARPAPQSADTGSGVGCVNLADRRLSAFVRIRVKGGRASVSLLPIHRALIFVSDTAHFLQHTSAAAAAEAAAAAASGRYAQKRHMREESVMKY